MVFSMGKTLVIAERPSVGRDLAGALDGVFQRRKLDDIKPKRGKKKVEEETNEEVVEKATSKPKATRAPGARSTRRGGRSGGWPLSRSCRRTASSSSRAMRRRRSS